MKGQISLEFLLVVVIFISIFAMIIPQINKTKNISDYALNLRNAELIINRVYYACERALITNNNEELEFDALTTFNLDSDDSRLIILFNDTRPDSEPNSKRELSKNKSFSCIIQEMELQKGKNTLNFLVENSRVQVSLTPNLT